MRFAHILHNTNNEHVRRYNKLIASKPIGAWTLAEGVERQRQWESECQDLLFAIQAQPGKHSER